VKEKNYKVLETLATAIARIDIDSPWGAYFLSVSAEGSGDFQRALWMADLAQKKAGGISGLFSYQKARVLYGLKETNLAMKEVEHAIALDSKLAEGYFFLAQIHDRDLETDLAVKNYQAALNADPKHYGALIYLAELRLQANKADDAASLYAKAIEVRPEQISSWLRLAYIYETVQKNNQLALNTYKGLKSSMDGGAVHGRPDFDLSAKIKALESTVQARVPAAQSQAAVVDKNKSVK
jgi:tetratricopeptide (TPR) repeat protein